MRVWKAGREGGREGGSMGTTLEAVYPSSGKCHLESQLNWTWKQVWRGKDREEQTDIRTGTWGPETKPQASLFRLECLVWIHAEQTHFRREAANEGLTQVAALAGPRLGCLWGDLWTRVLRSFLDLACLGGLDAEPPGRGENCSRASLLKAGWVLEAERTPVQGEWGVQRLGGGRDAGVQWLGLSYALCPEEGQDFLWVVLVFNCVNGCCALERELRRFEAKGGPSNPMDLFCASHPQHMGWVTKLSPLHFYPCRWHHPNGRKPRGTKELLY